MHLSIQKQIAHPNYFWNSPWLKAIESSAVDQGTSAWRKYLCFWKMKYEELTEMNVIGSSHFAGKWCDKWKRKEKKKNPENSRTFCSFYKCLLKEHCIDIHQRTTQSNSLRRANYRRGCWEVNFIASSQGWVSFLWPWKLQKVPVFAGSLAGVGVDEGGGPWGYWCILNLLKVLGLFSLCLKQDHKLCFLSVCVFNPKVWPSEKLFGDDWGHWYHRQELWTPSERLGVTLIHQRCDLDIHLRYFSKALFPHPFVPYILSVSWYYGSEWDDLRGIYCKYYESEYMKCT